MTVISVILTVLAVCMEQDATRTWEDALLKLFKTIGIDPKQIHTGSVLGKLLRACMKAGRNVTEHFHAERAKMRANQRLRSKADGTPKIDKRICAQTQHGEVRKVRRWHSVLFTVSSPDSQPIELVWRNSKIRVGTAFYEGRTLKDTLAQWHKALYGGFHVFGKPGSPEHTAKSATIQWKPIGPRQCRNLINESEGRIDVFIAGDSELEGDSLGDLVKQQHKGVLQQRRLGGTDNRRDVQDLLLGELRMHGRFYHDDPECILGENDQLQHIYDDDVDDVEIEP